MSHQLVVGRAVFSRLCICRRSTGAEWLLAASPAVAYVATVIADVATMIACWCPLSVGISLHCRYQLVWLLHPAHMLSAWAVNKGGLDAP